MTDSKLPDERPDDSPARAFLSAIGAGFGVVMLGTLAAVAPGDEKAYRPVAIQWFLPPMCAALAASVAAHKLGSSLGRVTALAVLALLSAFLIRGVLDYVALYDFVSGASTGADRGAVRGRLGAFWRWQIVVSMLSIALGGLLGVMFARPDQEDVSVLVEGW